MTNDVITAASNCITCAITKCEVELLSPPLAVQGLSVISHFFALPNVLALLQSLIAAKVLISWLLDVNVEVIRSEINGVEVTVLEVVISSVSKRLECLRSHPNCKVSEAVIELEDLHDELCLKISGER